MSTNTLTQREPTSATALEQVREARVQVPRTDIFETHEAIELWMDVPGADEKSVSVTLEQQVLSVEAAVVADAPSGYGLVYGEYRPDGFKRSFTLSTEVEREGISATVKDGVLRLTLPKAAEAKLRKIPVRSS